MPRGPESHPLQQPSSGHGMSQTTLASWKNLIDHAIEDLALIEDVDGISAEGRIIGSGQGNLDVEYTLRLDPAWHTREVRLRLSDGRGLWLTSDGAGRWMGENGHLGELDGAIDVDISATPFTNTLPIRRLELHTGESVEIAVVYISLGELAVSLDPQRYTCLEPLRRYRFDSLDSDFTRVLTTDGAGLVIFYTGLYIRLH